jgi:hypothetical protein
MSEIPQVFKVYDEVGEWVATFTSKQEAEDYGKWRAHPDFNKDIDNTLLDQTSYSPDSSD